MPLQDPHLAGLHREDGVHLPSTSNDEGRDSARTLRNAQYLATATGYHAIAAIASVRNDHEVKELIDNEQTPLVKTPQLSHTGNRAGAKHTLQLQPRRRTQWI